jgi:hypothetical protein
MINEQVPQEILDQLLDDAGQPLRFNFSEEIDPTAKSLVSMCLFAGKPVGVRYRVKDGVCSRVEVQV